MARKATDLLDVFRFGDDDGDENSKRDSGRGGRRVPKERKPKKAPRARSQSEEDVLQLNRRQILLGSSAVVLLLVLSFVLGLSAGRSGPSEDDTKIERRSGRDLIAIRGDLPLLDKATRKSIDPAQIAGVLKRDYGLKRKNIHMYRVSGRLVIDIGPFHSETQAKSYLRKSGLKMLHIHMEDPFRWPEFSAWKAAR